MRHASPGALRHLPLGVSLALASALLFGLSTPCAKLLLAETSPLLLAGLLYAGSGLGLSVIRASRRASSAEAGPSRTDLPWLAGAVAAGGVVAPVLLMWGLRATPASSASLLLNLEGVFTALLAWFAFHENVDRRIALGFFLILAGGLVLSWSSPGTGRLVLPFGALAVAGACLGWAIDNNLTQKVSAADPLRVAAIKGVAAGSVNLALAVAAGTPWPAALVVGAALLVGFVGYGLSLALFVLALRHLGTARTAAYFSVAPFLGGAASLLFLREPATPGFVAAAFLMAAGVWLHLTERHEHEHHHERVVHSHPHLHDEHHRHAHDPDTPPGEPHTHEHVHEPMTHSHPHYPDIHHRHRHG